MSTQAEIDTVASALLRGVRSGEVLAQAKDLVARRYSDQLVLAFMKQSAEEQCAAMTTVMDLLESLAMLDFTLAGALMVPLYDRAGAAFLHEICDAIDLWMYENRSPALAAHVRQVAHEVEDQDLRRHYLQWVETLDLPSGNA